MPQLIAPKDAKNEPFKLLSLLKKSSLLDDK